MVVFPSRPASWANSFSLSRPVRVSIFLNASLRASTCSVAIWVYLRVFAICSSISAKAFTARLPAMTIPDSSAAVMKIDDCQSFIVRVKRFQNPS